MAKPGDRIDIGSAIEPCGGTVAYIDHQLAVIRWDAGGRTVVPRLLMSALACSAEAHPAAESADADHGWRPH